MDDLVTVEHTFELCASMDDGVCECVICMLTKFERFTTVHPFSHIWYDEAENGEKERRGAKFAFFTTMLLHMNSNCNYGICPPQFTYVY